MQKDMAKSEVRMSSHPPVELFTRSLGSHPPIEPLMATNPQMELWVGFVNHVPLVGTSANMVDGFIALLQGDRRTAEAKGYKGFLDSAGIHQLKPGSILQNHKSQTVIGCSAKVSKDINDYIIQAVQKPGASAAITAAKAAKSGADLRKNLSASFEVLRGKLKERGIDLARDVIQARRSNRGEHVFNNALLGLYGSIIDVFIQRHVTGGDRVTLVGRIPNSRVSDAFQGHAPDGDHINLTAAQRRNISTWVVHIPDNVVYVPINNILFAYMTETISLNAVDYMHLFRLQQINENVLHILGRTVDWINTHRVYLDPQAAEIWFTENPNLIPQFHTTEDGVQLMLRHLDPQRSTLLRDFVNDLRQAGATFY
ncbi:uncharacterized protein LOC118226780 isoform X4 [Anguilla anguilla]|uniref:uncharacterized protein LOC118226780 isoform X3 n=1 Tax=Anguilla anguilla TaxID=7936 RepID=UPI0015B2B2A7|nr:uncharacterized protein LOC118226780 isoform X3 [Anguilla anguilla]XP_035272552.1 uncharacterized protein LOC118226780 isoform X4 [Anguilla anguilla]